MTTIEEGTMVNQRSASIREIVGLNIVRLRTGAGLSQNDLGVRLEQWLESPWSRQAVSQAEQGKRAFGVDDLVALSVGLDASVQQLLTPPKNVEGVALASGIELSTVSYEEVVLGGAAEMDEVQRSRIVGQLSELNSLAGVVASRQESLRSLLSGDGEKSVESQEPSQPKADLDNDLSDAGLGALGMRSQHLIVRVEGDGRLVKVGYLAEDGVDLINQGGGHDSLDNHGRGDDDDVIDLGRG